MSMVIAGLGIAEPPLKIAQADACEQCLELSCDAPEQRRLMQAIYRRSGVINKGSVVLRSTAGSLAERQDFFPPRQHAHDRGPGTAARNRRFHQEALPLALRASQAALLDAHVSPAQVTHLITASCTGFSAPGFDLGLVVELGLSAQVQRTHVGFMGCHSALNALRVARAFTMAEPEAVVLVCNVELCSLHHYYGWDSEKVIANALFADGAGAAVCRSTSTRQARFQTTAHGSCVLPGTADAMGWRIGDHGFEMSLSTAVPSLIQEHLRNWIESFLSKHHLRLPDVTTWAIHPGGPRILDACRDALPLDEAQLAISRLVLAQHGNMSSATMYFLLNQLAKQGFSGPIVALGFGPGLTIEAMLLETRQK